MGENFVELPLCFREVVGKKGITVFPLSLFVFIMAEESHKIKIYGSNTQITGSYPTLVIPDELKQDKRPEEDAPVLKTTEKSRLTTLENTIENNTKESNFKVKNYQAFTLVCFGSLFLIVIGLGFYTYLSNSSLEEDLSNQNDKIYQLREDMNAYQDDFESRLIPLE